MSINSLAFLGFLTVALVIYYLVPGRFRWMVLLGASGWFYLAYSVQAAAYLCVTILITYAAGRILEGMNLREKEQLKQAERTEKPAIKKHATRQKRRVLAAALVINFATLAVFKYLNTWFLTINSVLSLLHVELQFRPLNLLLPLGISFYIFQTASYLLDIYRGKAHAETNLAKYTLFVSYFPQMVQGPINRFGALEPQLLAGKQFDAENIRSGIQLMIWGMLKKVFIADILAASVGELYGNYANYSGLLVFFGAFLYCLQLYADFSGGTDIIRGASELFGIELAINFKRPYFSTNVDEFWRRWHISLGEWMKDYLFYPLALSKWLPRLCKKLRKPFGARVGKLLVPSIATVLVFLVVGIWQGPGLSNIAYGLWNGLLMSGAMLFEPGFVWLNKKLHLNPDGRGMHLFRIVRTCLLVTIGRYFSRSATLTGALGMLRQTVTRFAWNLNGDSFFTFGLTAQNYITLLIACAVLLFVSLQQERGVEIRKTLAQKSALVQFIPLFLGILLLIICVYLNSDYTAIAYVYENV